MKKLILTFFLLVSVLIFGQNNDFKFKSLDVGILGFHNNFKSEETKGFSGNLELMGNIEKNNISAYVNIGFGITEKNNKLKNLQGYTEYDLLYSRDLILNNFIVLQTQIGLGYITFANTSGEKDREALGMPIRLKFLFFTGRKFAIGLNPNVNINKVTTIYSAFLFITL